jgi:ABC-type transport system substrate-binding protein
VSPSAHPALKDRRVRQALNLAVDKASMARELFGGLYTVASQPAPPGAFGHDPAIVAYAYDPARARALLAAAGHASGFAMTIDFYGDEGDIYQRLAGDLAKVGVIAEVKPLAFQDAVRKFIANSWEGHAFRHVWSVVPEMDAIATMGSNSCLKNNPWFCDAEVSAMIDRINGEFDPAKREPLLRQLMRWYHDEAPTIYLLNSPEINAVSRRVSGFDNVNAVLAYDRMTVGR